jgi:hypothetical protein
MLAASLSATTLFLAAPLRAADPVRPSHLVWVTIAGTEDDADALTQALSAPLEELGLTLRATRAAEVLTPGIAPAERARPSVAIDARPGKEIVIQVWAGPHADEGPVRRAIPRDAPRAVLAEESAYAIRSILESLLAPPSESPAPPAPPPVAPALPPPLPPLPPPPAAPAKVAEPAPPPTEPPRRDRLGVDVLAFGDARFVADSSAAVGAGLAVDVPLRLGGWWKPDLSIAAFTDAPFTTPAAEVELHTTVYALRVVPSLELAHVGPVHVAAGIGAGVDFFHVAPSRASTGGPVSLAGAAVYDDPVIEGALQLRARLLQGVGLTLAFVVDGDSAPHEFEQVDPRGAESAALALWSVRPAITLGLCLPVTGVSACAGDR